MASRASRLTSALVVVVMGLGAAEARAQYGAGSSGPSAMNSANLGMYANPYMNPFVNPFMNPYATQMRTTPGNAALYFFGAQAAGGGIGSGQISGVRGGSRNPTSRLSASRPAEDYPQKPGVPSSVSRYFQRGPQNVGTGSFYNHQGRYYPTTRR